jgi:hypothetical protein
VVTHDDALLVAGLARIYGSERIYAIEREGKLLYAA